MYGDEKGVHVEEGGGLLLMLEMDMYYRNKFIHASKMFCKDGKSEIINNYDNRWYVYITFKMFH